MAEQERLTNKERREQARAERKAKEAEAAAKAKKQKLTGTLITVVVLGIIVAVVVTAVTGGVDAAAITIDRDDAESGRVAAGCEVVDTTALVPRDHLNAATAPPADALYTSIRPTHSGPHFENWSPEVPFTDRPLDERATTHNLEHGAVMVWFDPEQVDSSDLEELEAWARTLNASGFRSNGGGAAVMASAYTDPITSGKAYALRAWSVAVDCDDWNEDAFSSFVIENYGTHGVAPESFIGPYPEEALGYSDGEGPEDNANQDRMDDEPAGDDAPSDGETTDGEG